MIIQDIRYSLRQLRKSPGFALTLILTLSLSIGAATAVFCVLDAVVLRPLPYANPDRIINFDTHSGAGYMQPASWPSYKDERAQATSFSALAGYFKWRDVAVVGPNGPAVLPAVNTSDNFFDVFGVRPLLGNVSRHPSDKHRSLRVIGRLSPGVFHAMLPVCTQKIKTQAVFFRIDFIQKCSPQLDPLGWFQ